MKQLISRFKSKPRVAVIRLAGAIGSGPRMPLSDAAMGPVIERAFSKGKPSAVALVINSPGGSPVQSSLIAARIRRLADEKNIPVHAFVEDVAASGGYWLATAADKIWVDPSSIIGSIGVISAGFGAHEFMERQGFERRVHTSVESKSQLDPFLPQKAEDVARLKDLLGQLHETFTAHVTSRRGDKLSTEEKLFTGEFWLGQRAIELGLADEVGHLVPVMKELFGSKVRFAKYGRKKGLLQKFSGRLAAEIGADLSTSALTALEERALYGRYGL